MANRQTVQGVRTGGRSARVRESILGAAFDELVAHGYPGLSIEAVATRAGVHKTTIYRRWPTVEDLLLDALTAWSGGTAPMPDTGCIEGDLIAVGIRVAELLNGGAGRRVAALVLTAGLQTPGLRTATRRFFDHQVLRIQPVVHRAIERDELPADIDVDLLLATLRAPLFYRTVTTGEPVDHALITHAVKVTLAAARAGLLAG